MRHTHTQTRRYPIIYVALCNPKTPTFMRTPKQTRKILIGELARNMASLAEMVTVVQYSYIGPHGFFSSSRQLRECWCDREIMNRIQHLHCQSRRRSNKLDFVRNTQESHHQLRSNNKQDGHTRC